VLVPLVRLRLDSWSLAKFGILDKICESMLDGLEFLNNIRLFICRGKGRLL
jgi:hypothetical protein